MRVRNVDKNWDWTFGNGQLNYSRNINAVALDIQMRLKEWYNDCFFNLNQGIPWGVRLGSHNQKQLLDEDVQNTVLSVEGVLNIFNFTSQVNGRRYTCQFEVYTAYSIETIPINFEGI
ncbi:MAG: hypothetical protein II244_07805 [Clostridia bacterium]|nr:hypothetical protein [Clostridia bacterium]